MSRDHGVGENYGKYLRHVGEIQAYLEKWGEARGLVEQKLAREKADVQREHDEKLERIDSQLEKARHELLRVRSEVLGKAGSSLPLPDPAPNGSKEFADALATFEDIVKKCDEENHRLSGVAGKAIANRDNYGHLSVLAVTNDKPPVFPGLVAGAILVGGGVLVVMMWADIAGAWTFLFDSVTSFLRNSEAE